MEIPKSEIKIEQITPYLTHKLRRDVLYPELKIFEMEMDEDIDGIHFGAFYENKLVGVVSLFNKGESYQFRKLAVDPEYQQNGIGTSILNYITEYVQQNGGTTIWCNARLSAIGFYLKANFAQTGNLFSKNGIDYELLEKTIIPSSIHPTT
jgi:phosphoribosylformimino-5-aminoimidazole carboxamide ribotide isomerase